MGASAAPENGAPGTGGNPPNGQQPGGGANPAGGAGGNQPGSNPADAGTAGVDRSKLSPLLRGMTEDQINETFNSLFQAIRQPVNQPPAAPKVEAPKPVTNEDVKERFDPMSDKYDPVGAVRDIAQANYGGLLEDISRRANAGMKQALKAQLPDFDKHEADIDKVLAGVPANQVTQELVAQTYFAVLGAKEAARIQGERNKPATTVPPSTQKPEETPVKLSPEEESVARVMFRGSQDPIKDYLEAQKKMDAGYQLKVPENK